MASISVIQKIAKAATAPQRYSLEKVFWKYAANLQNTHAEVWFQ